MTISSLSLFLSFSLFFALSLYPLHVFAISLPLPFGFPCPPQTPRHFEVGEKGEDASRIFSVPDFVGDACKAIASRVRGAVAGVQFDDFHKARHIRFSKPQTARSPQDEFMLWGCGDGNITVDSCPYLSHSRHAVPDVFSAYYYFLFPFLSIVFMSLSSELGQDHPCLCVWYG